MLGEGPKIIASKFSKILQFWLLLKLFVAKCQKNNDNVESQVSFFNLSATGFVTVW